MSGRPGCKHSPSSSSVMAVDSNKVGPPKGDWGITNRKLIAGYFFLKLKVISFLNCKLFLFKIARYFFLKNASFFIFIQIILNK